MVLNLIFSIFNKYGVVGIPDMFMCFFLYPDIDCSMFFKTVAFNFFDAHKQK